MSHQELRDIAKAIREKQARIDALRAELISYGIDPFKTWDEQALSAHSMEQANV